MTRRPLCLAGEIQKSGVEVDTFLTNDPDCPVFGLNLACAYPFPQRKARVYTAFMERLRRLGNFVYVYPLWQTHITIVTFINFSMQTQPSPGRLAHFREIANSTLRTLYPLLSDRRQSWGSAFDLRFGRPLLSPRAAILPLSDQTGQIGAIREDVVKQLSTDKDLYQELVSLGLKVPPIIHSTVMRFVSPPPDIDLFLAQFDVIANETDLGRITIKELLVTAETRPYMRAGEVLRRFSLSRS